MKKLLIIFVSLATITVGTPVAIAGLIYTPNADIPYELYEENIDIQDELYMELGRAIDSLATDGDGVLDIGVTEDTINRMIYAVMKDNIDDFTYAPGDDCNDDACKYILSEEINVTDGPSGNVGLLGVWVDIYENTFVLNVYLEGMGYKTNAQIYLQFLDTDNYYEFKLDKIKLGSLPVPISALRDLANFVLEQANASFTIDSLDDDINQDLDDENIPVDVSINNFNVIVYKDGLAEYSRDSLLNEDPANEDIAEFAYEFINFIFESDLFSLGFFDGTDDNGFVGAEFDLSTFEFDEVRDGNPTFAVALEDVNADLEIVIADNPSLLTSSGVNEKINMVREVLINGYANYEQKYHLDMLNLDVSGLGYTDVSEIPGIINEVMDANPSIYVKDEEEYEFKTNIERLLYTSLETLDTGLYELEVGQDDINRGVFSTGVLQTTSQSFLYPNATTGDMTEIATAGVESFWIDFSEDVAQLKLLADINGYKIVGTISFEILDKFSTDDSFEVSLTDVSFGGFNIPNSLIASGFKLAVANSETVNFIEESELYPEGAIEFDFGILDLSVAGTEGVIRLTVGEDNIIELFNKEEDPENVDNTGNNAIEDILNIIFDNNLINFSVNGTATAEGNIVLAADVALLESTDVTDIPIYLYDLHDEDGFNAELFNVEEFMQDRVMSFVFNQVLDEPVFVLSEQSINKMFYSSMNGAQDIGTSVEYYNGTEDTVAELGVEAIWFDLVDDGVNNQIIIYAFADFNGLPSLIAVETSITYVTDPITGYNIEMILEFTSITIGKDAGETIDEYLDIPVDTLLGLIGDSFDTIPFATFDSTNNTISITAESVSLMIADGTAGDSMEDAVLEVVGITVANNEFRLNVEYLDTTVQETIEQYVAAVETVTSLFGEGGDLNDELDTVFAPDVDDTPEEIAAKEEVQSLLEEISNTINDPENGTADVEDVTQLFEVYSTLDQETQDDFLALLENNIDPSIFDGFDSSILGNEEESSPIG